ncbi:MAG: ATP-binding protein [Thermodesulfobacteriota bacterium]|nr:ATP-binding protein [Thermodesulfobacteriota bacterium]
MMERYPRWQKATIKKLMFERRVLLLSGPRQCGKTTLARELESNQTEYRTLDDGTLREAAENDPQGFIKRSTKTLIVDEVQRIPSLLSAIKKAVDEDTRPGQYLLTGSTNIQSLPTVRESLAGRIAKIRLRPLAQGEIEKNAARFIDSAFEQSFSRKHSHYDRDALLEIAFRGGFPEPMSLQDRGRKRWHSDYVNAILERDLKEIARIHRKNTIRELVHTLAAWSGKFMDISAIGSGLSIRRPTLESYINALETLYLIERVYPWTKTDYARVGKQNRLFMVDSGLMASQLSWKMDQVRLDSDRSGKLIETFAFNEIMAQVDAGEGRYELFHYRDREKREIDFLIEREDNALLGIEIKAGSAVGKSDFNHIRWFQKNLVKKQKFIGIVLYTGEFPASFGDNLWAIPFSLLWS